MQENTKHGINLKRKTEHTAGIKMEFNLCLSLAIHRSVRQDLSAEKTFIRSALRYIPLWTMNKRP